MSTSLQTPIQPRFRTIDGVSVRYAEGGDHLRDGIAVPSDQDDRACRAGQHLAGKRLRRRGFPGLDAQLGGKRSHGLLGAGERRGE